LWFEFSEHPKKDVSSTPLKTSTPNKLIIPLEVAYSLEGKTILLHPNIYNNNNNYNYYDHED